MIVSIRYTRAKVQMKYLCLILLATSVAGRFTEDLYRLLAKANAKENLIVSPLSAEIAMTMAYMGAEGKTAEELRTALKLATDKKKVASDYKEFFSALRGREKDAVLELANRIYVKNQYSLVPEYNQVMRDSFNADAVPISVANPTAAAALVNKWVSDQTRGKIRNIVTVDDMNPGLVAVLLNAIYFKGQWRYKFDKEKTREGKFQVSKNEETPAQMMSLIGTIKAAELDDLDAKVIKLPYRNSSLSMLIFLPNKIGGLSQLEDKIIGFSKPLSKRKVDVTLPMFKIEFETVLNAPLQKLGIRDAFNGGANFQGLVENSGIYIDKVIQKAFIEVNEEGAEAAAVTAIESVNRMLLPEQPTMEFKADHPFAYIIRDEKTVYFQGHVVSG